MEETMTLPRLHADIESRVQAIRASHPEWLCTKGCAGCCRRLADLPQLTAAEWKLLREGLTALPAEWLRKISQGMAAVDRQHEGPIICPLLDRSTNVCPVYAQRPVACRSYGFYMQRGQGLYCGDIETEVANGVLADVMWGNHDAIDRQLAALGGSRPITEWFADWKSDRQGAENQQSGE